MTALHSRVRDWALFLSVTGILAFIALERRHSANLQMSSEAPQHAQLIEAQR
jgi:hypothetical protein